MILHIAIDDKFIDMAYEIFEKASPNNNEFVVVTKQKEFRHIKKTPIKCISPLKFLSKEFAKSLQKYEFVVFHWLDDFKKQLVLNAPEEVKFVWIGWGGDYYCYLNKDLYLPHTKSLINNFLSSNNGYKRTLKDTIKNLIKHKFILRDIKNTVKVLNRINYFAPVLEEDYYLVSSSFEKFTPKYIDWNYGTLEDHLVRDSNLSIFGDSILIGNSATYENNHLDAFELLKSKNINLSKRKIVIPLSYGDPVYGDYIEKRAREIYKEKVEVLRKFIDIDEYNRIISSCSIAIMNHLRQQALGNIVIMMYMGAKVFLNKENPVYSFFKKNGAIIYPLEDLSNETMSQKLSADEIQINRQILLKYWSREMILKKTQTLIETVNRNG